MTEFEWDDENREHLALHRVSVNEAQEAAHNFTLDLDQYVVDGELRIETLGATDTGRVLKCVTTDRHELVRFVTAYDAPTSLKRLYLQSMVKPNDRT